MRKHKILLLLVLFVMVLLLGELVLVIPMVAIEKSPLSPPLLIPTTEPTRSSPSVVVMSIEISSPTQISELRQRPEITVTVYSKEESEGTGIAKVIVWKFEDARYLDIESIGRCVEDFKFRTQDISICNPEKDEWGRFTGQYCDWHGIYHYTECQGEGCRDCQSPDLQGLRSW